jgi:hypothetical protein
MSFVEVISNSVVWYEATAVYKSTSIGVSLLETSGGTTVSGTIAAGAYTKTSFATALQTLLNTLSPHTYTYTVSSDQVNYAQMPNSGTPVKWGSSFSVSFNGTGNFVLTIT